MKENPMQHEVPENLPSKNQGTSGEHQMGRRALLKGLLGLAAVGVVGARKSSAEDKRSQDTQGAEKNDQENNLEAGAERRERIQKFLGDIADYKGLGYQTIAVNGVTMQTHAKDVSLDALQMQIFGQGQRDSLNEKIRSRLHMQGMDPHQKMSYEKPYLLQMGSHSDPSEQVRIQYGDRKEIDPDLIVEKTVECPRFEVTAERKGDTLSIKMYDWLNLKRPLFFEKEMDIEPGPHPASSEDLDEIETALLNAGQHLNQAQTVVDSVVPNPEAARRKKTYEVLRAKSLDPGQKGRISAAFDRQKRLGGQVGLFAAPLHEPDKTKTINLNLYWAVLKGSGFHPIMVNGAVERIVMAFDGKIAQWNESSQTMNDRPVDATYTDRFGNQVKEHTSFPNGKKTGAWARIELTIHPSASAEHAENGLRPVNFELSQLGLGLHDLEGLVFVGNE